MAELAADLVMPPGEQLDFHEVIPVCAFPAAVAQAGELGPGTGWGGIGRVSGRRDYVGFVLLFVADYVVFEQSFGGLGLRAAERPVELVDASLAQHLREPFERLARLGEHADAAHGTVEAVRDAEIDLSGLGVALRDERLVAVREALVAGPVALGDFSRALVHDEKMVVFVQDARAQVCEFCLCQCPVFHIRKVSVSKDTVFYDKLAENALGTTLVVCPGVLRMSRALKIERQ